MGYSLAQLLADIKPYVLGWVGDAGGSAGPYAPSPHDLQSSHHAGTLADSQGPQFLLTSGARALTGNLAVNAGVTIDGVDLSVFAGRQIVAGAGLTGGGVLGAGDVTLNAGAGAGISVAADSVAVDQGFAFTWTAHHTFNAGATIAAGQALGFGADVQLARQAMDVLVLGSGDAFRSPTFTSGVAGWGINAAGDAEFNNVSVRGEIRASVFKVSEITATAGTLGVYYSAATVYEDVAIPADSTAFTIKLANSEAGAALFSTSSMLRIKSWTGAAVTDIWLDVTAVGANNGDHTLYTVSKQSGTGGITIRAGTAVVDYGPAGTGFITLSADGTIGSSPNLTMALATATPWTGFTPILRIGNLNNSYGQVANVYGVGIGTYSSGNYLLYNGSTFTIQAGNGNITLGPAGLLINTAASYANANAIRFGSGNLGTIYCTEATGGSPSLVFDVITESGTAIARVESTASTGGTAIITLSAQYTTDPAIELQFSASSGSKLASFSGMTFVSAPAYRASGASIIGSTSVAPDTILHVYAGSAGSVSGAGSVLTVENSGSAYIHVLHPAANEGGILFGDPTASISGGLIVNSVNDAVIRAGGNTTRFTFMADGRIYGQNIHNNGSLAGTTHYIGSGTYTPTITNGNNITSATPTTFQWMRVGRVVTVSGVFTIDPAAAGNTFFNFTLPWTIGVANTEQIAGTSFQPDTMAGAVIKGDPVNNLAYWHAGNLADAASRIWHVHFTFLVA